MLTYDTKVKNSYLQIKGILENLLTELGCYLTIEQADLKTNPLSSTMHKNRSANIVINGQNIGIISELKPSLQNSFGLEGRVAFVEIDLDQLLTLYKKEKAYHKLSVYPSVFRDLSFWMADKITFQQLISTIRTLELKTIKDIKFMDEFINPEKQGTKSITIRLELQDNIKTLTDKEIEPVITTIVNSITKELKATLRDSKSN